MAWLPGATGIRIPQKLPDDLLQRSTDAGRSFTTAGPWPFARDVGTTPHFLFLDEQDGLGLGPSRRKPMTTDVVETSDGGRSWTTVLP